MGHEDDGASEGADDARDVTGKFDRAGQDDAEGEGNEGEVGGRCVVDVEDEAVGEDGEEGGKTLDGVNEGNGDFFGGGGGQDMAAYLEHGEGEGGAYYVASRVADAVPEDGNGFL